MPRASLTVALTRLRSCSAASSCLARASAASVFSLSSLQAPAHLCYTGKIKDTRNFVSTVLCQVTTLPPALIGCLMCQGTCPFLQHITTTRTNSNSPSFVTRARLRTTRTLVSTVLCQVTTVPKAFTGCFMYQGTCPYLQHVLTTRSNNNSPAHEFGRYTEVADSCTSACSC